MDKERNSAIECLRILSMFVIVLGHFAWQTEWNFSFSTSVFLKSSIESLWIGGKFGVDIFVLISGYFLINTEFKWKSFFNVWILAYFYSIVIYLGTLIFKLDNFNIKDLLKTLFLSSEGYLSWFVTAYLIMYLFSPFLNIIFKNISKNQFKYLLLLMLIVFSLSTTMFRNPSVGTNGNDSVWVMVVYSFGAYIGLYEDDLKKIKKDTYVKLLAGTLMLSVLSVFLVNITSTVSHFFKDSDSYARFISGTSPFQLLSAISLFMIVLYIRPYTNKVVNRIASTSFAVYLIHANLLIVDWLWLTIVNGDKYSNSYFAIFYGILVSIIIFIICGLIDFARQILFGRVQNKIVNYMSGVAESLLNRFKI